MSAFEDAELQLVRNIRRLRKGRGLSQEDLGRLMQGLGPIKKYPQQTIYQIESGKRRVTIAEVLGLQEIFGLTLDQLTSAVMCGACADQPPPGFTCNDCGAKS